MEIWPHLAGKEKANRFFNKIALNLNERNIIYYVECDPALLDIPGIIVDVSEIKEKIASNVCIYVSPISIVIELRKMDEFYDLAFLYQVKHIAVPEESYGGNSLVYRNEREFLLYKDFLREFGKEHLADEYEECFRKNKKADKFHFD